MPGVSSSEQHTRLQDQESRIAELETRLAEAEETLRAIRTGEVDALVVAGPHGDQIFALEGADHAYRLLVEEMQEGTVTLDPDGLILYSNRQFASMMKTHTENLLGSRMQRFLPLDRYTAFARMLGDPTNRHKRNEFTLLAQDGATVPVHISLSRLETGGIETICVVITDLTEQRHYEAMVKDGELSRLILNQAAEAIVVIDTRGTILRASEAAQTLAGRNILFQHFDDAFRLRVPESGIDTARLIAAALSENHLRSLEVKLFHPDRPYSTLLLSTGSLWNSARELLGCVVTLTDITARKGSQEALERQAHALERTNSDLQQFAYAVSHDLREPIRIITIYNELLEKLYRSSLDERAQGFIQHTVQAAQRLEALLNDLLLYTQTDEDPQPVDSPLDANAVLANTLAMFDRLLAENRTRVESDVLPRLRVHEVHLQQIFQNLIGNSLKYRSDAPPAIYVSAERQGEMWQFHVADNGIGIDPQYHAQVFGLFKRLHGNRKYAGSGMGLAICQKIVERYGGRMWVESEVGKGSKFFFTLPAESEH